MSRTFTFLLVDVLNKFDPVKDPLKCHTNGTLQVGGFVRNGFMQFFKRDFIILYPNLPPPLTLYIR